MLRHRWAPALALFMQACAADEGASRDVNAAINDVLLLDITPDVTRDATTLEVQPEVTQLPREIEPIRVIVKVHLEDLVKYEGPIKLAQFQKFFKFVDFNVKPIAEAHGAPLSIHGNGDWWELAAADASRAPRIAAWRDAGHELAPHVHAVYKDDVSQKWIDIPREEQSNDARIDEAWQDCIDALHQLIPDHTIDAITPFNNHEEGIAARLERFGIGVLGGGHRNEVAESWYGHYPHHGWRVGARWLEEDKGASSVIIPTHPQLDKVSDHGGGETFIDRSLGRMKLRFLQTFLEWLEAERSGTHDGRIMHLGVVVHDNQDLDTMAVTLEDWLSWLDETFVGQASARGHVIAEYATETQTGAAVQRWYRNHLGASHFNVPTPASAAGGAADVDHNENTITDADADASYPYAFRGLAELFASPLERVVNWKRRVTIFASAGVAAHELETGPRDTPDVATTQHPRRMWLLYRELDGSATVDLSQLDPATTWLVHDGRSGAVTEASGNIQVGATPLVVEPKRTRILFTLNSHDWVFEDLSQDLLLWLTTLHNARQVPLDVYFTDAVLQRLAGNAPLAVAVAASNQISTSFFFRPPTPFYEDGGYFDQAWYDASAAEVAAGTRSWADILPAFIDLELDLRDGRPKPSVAGGIALMQSLGIAPTGAAGAAGNGELDKALAQLFKARGVRFMAGKQTYDLGDTQVSSGLLWRPEHAPIRLWENMWVDHTDPAQLEAHALALLATAKQDALLARCGAATTDCAGTTYVAIKMHDSDFYANGTPFKPVYDNLPSPWIITGAERLTALHSAAEQDKRRAVWQELVRLVDEDRTHYEAVNLEGLATEL